MAYIKAKAKTALKAKAFRFALFVKLYNHIPFNNKIKKLRGNAVKCEGILQKCQIVFNGKGNSVFIEKGVVLKNCVINISGNNNKVILKEGAYGKYADFCLQDNGNLIEVGEHSSFAGKIHLACIEGTKIIIGEDCLFSSDIVFRTGDSHVIVDMEGNRTNFSKDIVIGNHVWIGHRVLVNKGVQIGNNIIIGTGAIVTKSLLNDNCLYVGVPAKLAKQNVNWQAER